MMSADMILLPLPPGRSELSAARAMFRERSGYPVGVVPSIVPPIPPRRYLDALDDLRSEFALRSPRSSSSTAGCAVASWQRRWCASPALRPRQRARPSSSARSPPTPWHCSRWLMSKRPEAWREQGLAHNPSPRLPVEGDPATPGIHRPPTLPPPPTPPPAPPARAEAPPPRVADAVPALPSPPPHAALPGPEGLPRRRTSRCGSAVPLTPSWPRGLHAVARRASGEARRNSSSLLLWEEASLDDDEVAGPLATFRRRAPR